MPTIEIHPQNVCSRLLTVEYDDNGIVTKATHLGGCKGNLDGVCALIVGMKIEDVVKRLEGIQCRNGTSCPDQLARGLKPLLK